ncbi:MAG: TRAP transporter large permease subunit, partial [Pseudomonadota bacterium]
MSPVVIGLIGIAVLVLLFFSRMPVAYCMALVGYVGFSIVSSPQGGLNLLAREMYDTFSSYGLTVIPLFILMGQLAFNAGISRRLYDSAYKFVGATSGGLAMATVCACTAFGAVCGSSPATAATMATVSLPEMKRYGYGDRLSSGSVAAGGSLGMLMPPSVVMIVYGILTEQSIGQLFIAGIMPAVFITICFIVAVLTYVWMVPGEGPAGERFTWAERLVSLWGMGETMSVFILVMGGLYMG